MVIGFVTSNEYRLGLIQGWFSTYLKRTLDDNGALYWLQQMQLGASQESIQTGILAEPFPPTPDERRALQEKRDQLSPEMRKKLNADDFFGLDERAEQEGDEN